MNLPHSPSPTFPAGADWLPPESPLAMPVQALDQPGETDVPLPSAPRHMAARRLFVLGGGIALTLAAAVPVLSTLRRDGLVLLELLTLLMFLVLFAWIAVSFLSAVAGFVLVLSRGDRRLGIDAPALPVLATRTALLVPTYNEDPARLLAGVQAIAESLHHTGQAAAFDLYVLSDTTRPAIAQDEAREFRALCARLDGVANVYYRRRERNVGRKAGNIAEWVRRFGAAYPQMLILDADSLMSGDTVVRLAGAMERHPDVALIQTLPSIVNGRTLFARMQQFASRVYGPVQAHGIAWWQGAESNYWGHNAIIRTEAFAAHAGLPELTGPTPFAGAVLSHDFVEAALLRRGGWALHMVPGLGGSYEEGPPSLGDMLIRDRRWCQGNLQHGGVLGARGLHWVSRVHLAMGIVQYLVSPLWAMLMIAGLAIPLLQGLFGTSQINLDAWATQLSWLGNRDALLQVFLLTMAMLLVPKLLGLAATMRDARTRRDCGGVLRASAGVLIESLLTALIAPVTMYMHSRAVAEVLAGQDSGWNPQRRDDGSVPWSDLVRDYGGLSVFGALIGAMAYAASPALAAWMLPVIIGMVLAIPVAKLTSSLRVGGWLRRHRLLMTPEERRPPAVLARAMQLRRQQPAEEFATGLGVDATQEPVAELVS
ncbi:glucans biosynthesis glucosyltransferase MdoH [Arenimonas sp. MALMAid1274]|uniref:glucans biosynthesis glucosyltransferase MdoH n=1 Tax=Arenimonas sp. MALMAid1274 TaxID=3411630 RepID=UPI003BA19252